MLVIVGYVIVLASVFGGFAMAGGHLASLFQPVELLMIGGGANRPGLAPALSAAVRRLKVPFFNTQMGKGAVDGNPELFVGTAALSEGDYVHLAIERADLIVAQIAR